MIQNFEPIELESNFDYPAFNQYGNHQEEISRPSDPSVPCNTPNYLPPFCEDAGYVNINAYTPMLMLIALVIGLIVIQKFKLKTNGK